MMSAQQRILQTASFQTLITASLGLLFLALPISSTAKSIFLVSSVILVLSWPAHREQLRDVFSHGWCKAALFLFFIALIACLWSPALYSERILVLEKYSKLLFLPILAVGFRDENTRKYALNAFLLAMTITALVSIYKYWNVSPFGINDPGHVFRNHIMTGYMIAFSAYLSLLLAFRQAGRNRLIYGLLFGLFSYQIWFVNTGRTGYVIYLILLILFIVQFFSWRQGLLVLLISCSLLAIIYYEHPGIQTRVEQIVEDLQSYSQNQKDTSVGYRLQFHSFARQLFMHQPYWGNGTGSFTYLFSELKPVPSWDRRLLEPHSFYWLVAAEFGLVGISALLFFFASLLAAAYRLDTMRAMAFAILLPFMAGNLSDSLLFYSGSGYFFILFMALCLGEALGRQKKLQEGANRQA